MNFHLNTTLASEHTHTCPSNDTMTIGLYNNMACALIRKECFQSSIHLLNRALLLLSQHVRQCPPSLSLGNHEGNSNNNCQDEDPLCPHYYPDNEYDKGMETFSQPVLICQQCSGNDCSSTDEATVLFNLGISHSRMRKDTEALEYFRQALDIQHGIDPLAGPSLYVILHNIGHLHWKAGRNSDAITSYQKALDFLQYEDASRADLLQHESTYDCHIGISCTLNCIAVVKYHADDPDTNEILSFLATALALRVNHPHSVYDRATASIMRNKGHVYVSRGEYADALIAYKEAHKLQVAILGENHIDAASTLFNIALVEEQLGHASVAIDLYKQFVATLVLNKGEGCGEVVGALLHVGRLLHHNSNMDQSHYFYSWALHCAKLAFGLHDSRVAKILNQIGNVLHDQGKYNLALEAYHSGLALERILPSTLDENIATSLLNIAQTYTCQHRWDEALEVYVKVLDIKRRFDDHEMVITILSYVGLIYQTKGMLDEAALMFEEAVTMLRGLDHDDNSQLSSALNVLGIIYYKKGSSPLALSLFLEAIEIRRSSQETNTRDLIGVYLNVASIYKSIDETDMALEIYQRILCLEERIEEEHQGGDSMSSHEKIALVHREIGLLLQARGDLGDAIHNLELASDIVMDYSTVIRRDSAYKIFLSLGALYVQIGDVDEATQTLLSMRMMYDDASDIALGQGAVRIRINALEWQASLSEMSQVATAAAAA